MTFTTALFNLAGVSESRLVSYCFGGRNGQRAVMSNPTGIKTNFDGGISGDLALTKLQDGWGRWSNFHNEFTSGANAGEAEHNGSLTLKKYSKKGDLQETVIYEFKKIAPVMLALGNAEAGKKTEVLTICFEDLDLKCFAEAPPPKAGK